MRHSAASGVAQSNTARIVAAAADLALFVDKKGIVREVSLGDSVEPHKGWDGLVGRSWAETVTVESRNKVELLLKEAQQKGSTKAREINQEAEGVGEVPFRFKAVYLNDEQRIAAVGRDLRPLAKLQQGLINSQQAMDREYTRLRQADTRYRVLFHVTSEGVLVADGSTHKILEANPAAASLIGDSAASIQGTTLEELFDPKSQAAIHSLAIGITAGARPIETRAYLLGQPEREMTVTAALFRQGNAMVLLIRFWPTKEARESKGTSKTLAVIEAMPDAFVVATPDRRIVTVNTAFCQLVDASANQVIGEPLDRWLGRPGVDLSIILANLREHGVVNNFATIVRSDFGPPQEALITAVSALDGKSPCLGFTIRAVSSRLPTVTANTGMLPRSVEQLRELVGRVPLKDLVREAADLVERLCIEAALHVSNNNRASAAQLLGLSRQGFYLKLHRHGFSDDSNE